MNELLALAGAHKALTAVAVAAVVVGGGIVAATAVGSTIATVTKVVDGDTIDVRYGGREHRVRLLNIDTPEAVDPNSPVECLGPEASDWLKQRLPVGTEVRLERDEETRDRYDRELAAVFLGDEFVNAEIARAGMGVAMSVGPNVKFLPQVEAAQAEAVSGGRGLYATSIECTVPARVEELSSAATETVGQEPAGAAALADFDSHRAELVALLVTAKDLLALLDGDADVLPMAAYRNQTSTLRWQVARVQDRLESAETRNGIARDARKSQLAEEARRAAEEAARQAAAEAARQAAAERAAAAARAAQQSAPSYRPPSPSTATRTAAPPPSNSGSGSSTYTGCRSYAPGGKTWTPIPC
ncbi:thermonuclease family protein [Blastococcus colisei]|uniref:thermonuclease family protein n=1 Tax=Blastococcus colisei TaxID=1564162 RepID=UPI001476F744|nr:thermonuclease family protein [Blastococcus colisei]